MQLFKKEKDATSADPALASTLTEILDKLIILERKIDSLGGRPHFRRPPMGNSMGGNRYAPRPGHFQSHGHGQGNRQFHGPRRHEHGPRRHAQDPNFPAKFTNH